MERAQLKAMLEHEGVCEDAYSLEGGHPSEAYVLDQVSGGRWRVYYSERGQEVGPACFDSEAKAVEHLLGLLRADPSTRKCPRR